MREVSLFKEDTNNESDDSPGSFSAQTNICSPCQSSLQTINIQCSAKHCHNCNLYNADTESMNTSQSSSDSSSLDINQMSNMTKDQREFMHIHYLFDHISFGILQKFAKKGIIPRKFANVDPPLCIDCHLGKAHRLKRNKSNKISSELIKQPGDLIHMDQAESSNPGRPMTHSGRNNKTKIVCFTIFVDSISKKIFVEFQTSTNSQQTLAGKHRMELNAKHHGVKIKHFRADNGIFKAAEIKIDIEKKQQRISFCGVGAHNQNGVAERHIRTIVERARTILLHATTRWPNTIKTELWTFTVNYTVDKWNSTPREDLNYLSPD